MKCHYLPVIVPIWLQESQQVYYGLHFPDKETEAHVYEFCHD